jgi:small subunit ribosomal protein S5
LRLWHIDAGYAMQSYQPARCTLAKCASFSVKSAPSFTQRSFSCSRQLFYPRNRPHYPSIKASELQKLETRAQEAYPAYDLSDTPLVSKKYTPSQIAAIRAAESAVDRKDLITQGVRRHDIGALPYSDDDLADVDGVLDNQPHKHGWPLPPGVGQDGFQPKTEEELQEAYLRWVVDMGAKYTKDGTIDPEQYPDIEQHLEVEWEKFANNPRSLFNASDERVYEMMEDPTYDVSAPKLPKMKDSLTQATMRTDNAQEDPEQKYLALRMGWTVQDVRRITSKVLVTRDVAVQTRMGKIRSRYCLAVAGNRNGLLGIGEGKSAEPAEARMQALSAAIRNMRAIPRYEKRTIFGEVHGKVGGTELVLRSKPPGTFLRIS